MRMWLKPALGVLLLSLGQPGVAANPSKAVPPATPSQAIDGLADLDTDRIWTDPEYAKRVLAQGDLIKASFKDPELLFAADSVRMLALVALGRDREALSVARDLTVARPHEPAPQMMAFAVAAMHDPREAVAILETAERSLTAADTRSEFRSSIEEELLFSIVRSIRKDEALKSRFAEALLRLGIPTNTRIHTADVLRKMAIEARLRKGDIARARGLAGDIRDPGTFITLLTSAEFEPARPAGAPEGALRTAIAAFDRGTAAALLARPDDLKAVLQRAQYFRAVGREHEALDLLLPYTKDLKKVREVGTDAFWIVNEAGYSLAALNRPAEAISLLQKLVGLGLREYPDLINMAINLSQLMVGVDRHAEGAAYAVKLAAEFRDLASPYGEMWMWSAAACGYGLEGNRAAAEPWLAKLHKQSDDNPAALLRAQLCANDHAGAAALVIKRLNGAEAEDMLSAMQDYQLNEYPSRSRQLVESRWREVIRRRDVQAALARKGRILAVPLSRIYYGLF